MRDVTAPAKTWVARGGRGEDALFDNTKVSEVSNGTHAQRD